MTTNFARLTNNFAIDLLLKIFLMPFNGLSFENLGSMALGVSLNLLWLPAPMRPAITPANITGKIKLPATLINWLKNPGNDSTVIRSVLICWMVLMRYIWNVATILGAIMVNTISASVSSTSVDTSALFAN